MGLFTDYFNLVKYYNDKYSKNIVLIQNGAFFEMYGILEEPCVNPQSFQVATICGLKWAKKSNVKIFGRDLYQIGFRDYMLEKYLNIITDEGYTVVVYKQDEMNKGTTRSLQGIYSPGTIFNDDKGVSNVIVCITIDIQRNLLKRQTYIHIGLSSIDILSGKNYMSEITKKFIHDTTTYDDVERFVSILQPCEVVIVYSPQVETQIDEIIQYCSIPSNVKIHKISKYQKEPDDVQCSSMIHIEDTMRSYRETYELCSKQNYQDEIVKKYFNHLYDDIDTFIDTIHIYEYPVGFQSLCFLLEFVYAHNPSIVDKLQEPVLFQELNSMILANHSLRQLNILDDGYVLSRTTKPLTSSVARFVNRCCTRMGRRNLYNQITHPWTNIEKLNHEYSYTKLFDDCIDLKYIRELLNTMIDMETTYRKIHLKKIKVDDIEHIYKTCKNLNNNLLRVIKPIEGYFNHSLLFYKKLSDELIEMIEYHFGDFNNYFYLNQDTYRDIYKEYQNIQENTKYIDDIMNYMNKLLSKNPETPTENCKIDKQTIKMTKKRFERFKKLCDKNVKFSSWKWNTTTLNGIPLSKTSTEVKIDNPQLNEILIQREEYQQDVERVLRETYNHILELLKKYQKHFYELSSLIISIDILQNRVYISKKYNLVCPEIDETRTTSCVYAENMRHILIEQIQTREPYVPNTVSLGYDENGILLFGTNASGKSSLIKSLGICIVLAQSGFYVPCTSFKFFPYKSLFTRILGNDNIFKSLSTYAVEMSEFRTILKYADDRSLILGDELCSGTEIGSALSIFSAGLITLHNRCSHFMFATHFHQLTTMKCIKELDRLKYKHLAIEVDGENNLIYDRRLRDGPGNNMYGIMVCKSLGLPDEFIELANNIRFSLYPETSMTTKFNKSSPYNSEKLKGLCEMCNKKADDIHHLQFQSQADGSGFIGSIHKNHKSNLMSICKECHNSLHDTPLVRRKTLKGYILKKT